MKASGEATSLDEALLDLQTEDGEISLTRYEEGVLSIIVLDNDHADCRPTKCCGVSGASLSKEQVIRLRDALTRFLET